MKKIAVVTGASSGLGAEFALQISHDYQNFFDELWLIARRKENLDNLADKLSFLPQEKKIKTISLDLSGKNGVNSLNDFFLLEKQNLESENKKLNISILVNNAGFGTYGPFEKTPVEKEMQMVDLNCTTVTGICGISLPFMNENSIIINTSSLAAFMPLGNFAVYAATKSFVLSFSIALAAELKEKGIKVCALCPGSVSTEFANVASNGVRKEVKGGIAPQKVVQHCLKRAFKGKKTSLYRFKWHFTAFLSRFVGRFLVAEFTYKYHKRPFNYEENERLNQMAIIAPFDLT